MSARQRLRSVLLVSLLGSLLGIAAVAAIWAPRDGFSVPRFLAGAAPVVVVLAVLVYATARRGERR
ncbi:hypothetical protein [Streptomyces anulatus]|uniref:hypothetical protein n=1 Tax=Streptomyces anulatus TaxID=1892 RepID=UPI0037DDA80A|nr:hypothetical protein OHB50_39340 [Streptomyces anulatus]